MPTEAAVPELPASVVVRQGDTALVRVEKEAIDLTPLAAAAVVATAAVNVSYFASTVV